MKNLDQGMEDLKRQLVFKLNCDRSRMSGLKDKMEENYMQFFVWYSEELYKLEFHAVQLEKLLSFIEGGDITKVCEYIEAEIDRIGDILTERRLRQNSTSPTSNLAFVYELEVSQEIYREFKILLNFNVSSI